MFDRVRDAVRSWLAGPTGVQLSLQRPRPFGSRAPRGQIAKDLPFFDSWIHHPEFDASAKRVLAAWREAEAGDPTQQNAMIDGFIEGDCHARMLFEKREQAVAGKPRVIQAGDSTSDGQRAAEVLRVAMDRLPLVSTLEHLLKYNRNGYQACEIDWDLRNILGRDWIVPTWFTPVDARRFRIASGALAQMAGSGLDELRIVTDYRRPQGDALIPGKWFVLRRSSTALARSGLMRTGIWPALGKKYGFTGWVVWADKYGQPLAVAKYQENVDAAGKDAAEQSLRTLGETRGVLLPEGVDITFAEAGRFGGSGSVHQPLIDHCNAELSKLVNGSTLTSDNKGSGGASYALGSVHEGVRWEAVQYDAEKIETAFESDVSAAFCAFNNLRCAPPKLKIQVVRDLDPVTRVQVADIYVNKLGGKISGQQMGQELGFREPSAGDEMPGAPKPTEATKPAAAPEREAA